MTQGQKPLRPGAAWQRDLENTDFKFDPAQQRAVGSLDRIYDAMVEPSSWFDRFRSRAVRGLYMYGGVGRGKTYLMDLLFEGLPASTSKRRVHFHRFMEDVHDRMREHRRERDPLRAVGKELAAEARVLCFDEFFVVDIADAMILAELLDTMFQSGATLVTTSNVHPDNLYRDGLQRAKFLPTIALLHRHCEVLSVDGGEDYRLRYLKSAEIYHHPLDDAAADILSESMQQLAPGAIERDRIMQINHRPLSAVAMADGVAWLTFAELCQAARAPSDYIELARRFNTLLIDGVPQLGEDQNDPTRRFISLIDELYDRSVNVVITAQVPAQQLYVGERLAFEFQRTVSRLTEMQSETYLGAPHRP